MVIPGPVTRNLFFTGKGGVGKTSVASATAVGLADAGQAGAACEHRPGLEPRRGLRRRAGDAPTPIPEVPDLFAMNIDPEAAAHAYRERMVGPYRGILPDASVRSMEEQFSGACTTEIAAFDEFSRLLGDASATAEFDHVIFDTAPTGHTLRLLQLPAAWTVFFENNVGGNSCLGPLSGLTAQRALYEAALKASPTGHDDARARQPGREDGLSGGRPHEPRARRAGHPQPAARRQRRLPRDRRKRRDGRRDGGPRPGGTGRDAGRLSLVCPAWMSGFCPSGSLVFRHCGR